MRRKETTMTRRVRSVASLCVCCSDACEEHEHTHVRLMRANGAASVRAAVWSLSCGRLCRPTMVERTETKAGVRVRQPEQATITLNSLTHCIRTNTLTPLLCPFHFDSTEFTLYRQFDIIFWCWCFCLRLTTIYLHLNNNCCWILIFFFVQSDHLFGKYDVSILSYLSIGKFRNAPGQLTRYSWILNYRFITFFFVPFNTKYFINKKWNCAKQLTVYIVFVVVASQCSNRVQIENRRSDHSTICDI